MLDPRKLDLYFNADSEASQHRSHSVANSYSRLVKLAKIALPSIASVLILLLLLLPSVNSTKNQIKIDITKPKINELEKLHVENTIFYITDSQNKISNFTATNIDETATGSKIIKITQIEGMIPQEKDSWLNMKSPLGYFNQNTNVLTLPQNVELFYSQGMNIFTNEAIFNFKDNHAQGNNPVTGQGFLGNFEATGFEILGNTHILKFLGPATFIINEESFAQ